MKMLPGQNPERDELHLWKPFRSACNGVSIREYKCLMRHQIDSNAAGLQIRSGNGLEQVKGCGSHHLDSHVRHIISVSDSEEEDEDSTFPI